jgi:hypothetical protein
MIALLSPIEWKNRALAQIAQGGVHPAGNATAYRHGDSQDVLTKTNCPRVAARRPRSAAV